MAPRGGGPRWTTVLIAVVCAWVGIAAVGLQTTGAAFSRTTSNAGNSFQALGAFPCTAPGTQTLLSVADTHVRQNNANNNYGTTTTMQVRSGNNNNRRSLLRFTLPPIPNRCTITSATLRLWVTVASAGRTYQAFRAGAAWTETAVTWNTQPATTGTAATVVTTAATGWLQWTVTSQVQAMYPTNNGFVVRDQNENNGTNVTNTFSTREGTNDPQLVITFG
jgi:hypothetical protein